MYCWAGERAKCRLGELSRAWCSKDRPWKKNEGRKAVVQEVVEIVGPEVRSGRSRRVKVG